jgi:wyosine [tRNA(Phe)-imidazoG37] synthetase (radical SAM superfamily)
MAIAFGPVPSRRLGRSLGINNIPAKFCTYACVYCQVGRTPHMQIERRAFYAPQDIYEAVLAKIEEARDVGETIDYLTFVPDGEPTLDIHLGRAITLLKPLGVKIAVISNGSLIWREDARTDLMNADWVSLKLDAAREATWRKVDRPHGALQLPAILDGMRSFAETFAGELVIETMLVSGVNDGEQDVEAVAAFLAQINPTIAYLAIPTRPPAEAWVQPPDETAVIRAYQCFSAHLPHVEYLIGYEGDAFASTGDVTDDLLSITAVHPMRREAVEDFLDRAGADWAVIEALLETETLIALDYGGKRFYMRRLPTRQR